MIPHLRDSRVLRAALIAWRRGVRVSVAEEALNAVNRRVPQLRTIVATASPQPADYGPSDERLVEREGGRWLLRPAHYFQWHLLFGHADPVLVALRHLAVGARLIVDAGANVGVYAVLMAKASPGAAVHAFEPAPETFRRLTLHAAMNDVPNLATYRQGLGDAPARLPLWDAGGGDSGKASLRPESGAASIAEIEVTTLDAHLGADADRLDLLKIDVEGHEPALLRGAGRALAAHPVLVLEFSPQWYCPSDLDVFVGLEQVGYEFHEINGPGVTLRPVSMATLFRDQQQCNLLGVPPRRRVDLSWARRGT